MSDTQEYSIKPFDANLINPREDNFNTVGGSKIVVIVRQVLVNLL